MSLYTEIYNFLKEGRPRTVNKDVEDIKKGKIIMKPGADDYGTDDVSSERQRRKAPEKRNLATTPSDVSTKSSFEEGKVHKIIFKNIFKDQTRQYVTLYRKITESDYKKIKGNPKIAAIVQPSDKEDHYQDIYYLTPKEAISGDVEGYATFSIADKKQVEDESKYGEFALDLSPVTVDDISKGVNLRYYKVETVKEYLDGKIARVSKSKEKTDKQLQKKTEKEKKVSDEIGNFLAANDNVIDNMVSSFNKMKAIGAKSDTIEFYRDAMDKLGDRFVERLKQVNAEVLDGVFKKLEEKLKDKPQVFSLIKDKYYGKKTDITPDIKDKEKAKKDKSQPAASKDKKEPAKKETLDAKQKAEKYISDNKHLVNINNLIKAYAASEERNEKGVYVYDREERGYQRNQMFSFIPKVMDQIFKYSSSDEVRNAIMDRIETRVDGLIGAGDESDELNKIIRTAYDNMKKKAVKEMAITEASKKYIVKTKIGSRADSVYKKGSKTLNADEKGNPIPGEYVINLDDEQISKLQADSEEMGILSIDPYEPGPAAPQEKTPEEMLYKVSLSVGGGREQEVNMTGKEILKSLQKNPDYSKVTFKDLKEKEPYSIKGKDGKDAILTIKTLKPFGQFGQRKAFDTIDAAQSKRNRKANEPETRKVSVRVPYQAPQTITYAANKGVKMAKTNPDKFIFKFYVVDVEKNEKVKGFDDWGEAKKAAEKMGPRYKAMQKGEMAAKSVTETLSKEDKGKLMDTQIKFTIQSKKDADKQLQLSDNVSNYKDEKTKFVIVLKKLGTLTFNRDMTASFKDAKNNEEYQALNIPKELESIVKKSFEAAKTPDSDVLEAYIRQRIRRALQETELGQYFGVQGPEVKKKRLEEYMKKYEWGFQESEDPYVRGTGAEKHAIVSKLVHELGDEGVAIFNSYAPKGQEIARPDDLNDMADTPLGSQLYQPYDPNSLTARGGRVAEQDANYDSLYNQAKRDVENKYKDVESLAAGYNRRDREIERSPTLKKIIQKAIQKAYGEDPSNATPELGKAFRRISDEDLKSST